MKTRFTKEELYAVRNFIPIDFVISNSLKLPTKVDNGMLHFQCPHCGGLNTATNSRTNLARCFQCAQNFNTIDIVMFVKRIDFVSSVHLLKALQNERPLETKVRQQEVGKRDSIKPDQQPGTATLCASVRDILRGIVV